MIQRAFAAIALFLGLACPMFPQTTVADSRACDDAPLVTLTQLAGRVLRTPPAEYPQIAQSARVQGVVLIEVCLSESGEVVQARTVDGPLMLIGASTENAAITHFRPDPAVVRTVLEFSYSLDLPAATIASLRDRGRFFAATQERCRLSLQANSKDALDRCKELATAAEVFSKAPGPDLRKAYQLIGQAYSGQSQFDEALRFLERWLADARRSDSLRPRAVAPDLVGPKTEVGAAYYAVAVALDQLGRAKEADNNYKKAEEATMDVRKKATTTALKQMHSVTLDLVRGKHMAMLRRSGLSTADLEKQIRQQP